MKVTCMSSEYERFDSKYFVDPFSGCWVWLASVQKNGYSQFKTELTTLAHRVSYERHIGPIPFGLQLDHLCKNKTCVNPDHLEPVTQKVNLHRASNTLPAINSAKTHCPKGHAYIEGNLYFSKKGGRICKTCSDERVSNRRKNNTVKCLQEGCYSPSYSKGMCYSHYRKDKYKYTGVS